ncbi:hypothetical protein CO229_02590 [Mycoplasmopsis bovirhinis]|uniref:hypothetical protein n=1 Tax=Mycoplasmopsis bovirhinis TaxID=29553 RepID=UPI000C05BCAB|nr:hypothetical protein [Mycoplasmopsis bovirhinis]ATO30987.1 hypothetical protein CO229_02590 [Mycoplasmopsis bovirhinis]
MIIKWTVAIPLITGDTGSLSSYVFISLNLYSMFIFLSLTLNLLIQYPDPLTTLLGVPVL